MLGSTCAPTCSAPMSIMDTGVRLLYNPHGGHDSLRNH